MTPKAQKTNKRNIQSWLKTLIRWVQSLFNKKAISYKTNIIKTIKSEDSRSVLLVLARESIGAVRTIRVNSIALGNKSILITVDNLLALNKKARQELQIKYSGSRVAASPTHRIAVSVIAGSREPEFIGIWDANLIRVDAGSEDVAAGRIGFTLAYRLLMSLGEFYDLELQQVFKATWWEDRLANIITNEFGHYHVAKLTRLR